MNPNNILDKLFSIMLFLLVIGYLSINFIANLPTFLIIENVFYATAYSIVLIASVKGKKKTTNLALLIALLGFNIGRVSRSIVSPTGEIKTLALEHIPLLVFLLIVLTIAMIKLYEAQKSTN